MSVNPSNEEIPSNELDLNSDAAPLEELNEVSRVRMFESLVEETLIGRGINEVRVPGVESDLVEPLVTECTVVNFVGQNSSYEPVLADCSAMVRGAGDEVRVSGEGDDQVELVAAERMDGIQDVYIGCSSSAVKELVEERTEMMLEVADDVQESRGSAECGSLNSTEDDDSSGIIGWSSSYKPMLVDSSNMACVSVVAECMIQSGGHEVSVSRERHDVVIESMDGRNLNRVVGVNGVMVSGVGDSKTVAREAADEQPGVVMVNDKDEAASEEKVAGHAVYGNNEESVSVPDEKQEVAVEVAETRYNYVDGDQRTASNAVEENLNVTDANVEEAGATAECAGLNRMNKLDSGRFTGSMGPLENGNMDIDGGGVICNASKDEGEERAEMVAAKWEDSLTTPQTLVEKTKVIVGGEVIAVEIRDVSEVSETNIVDMSSSLGGSLESLQQRDVEPENETVTPVAEATFDQVEIEDPVTQRLTSELEEQKAKSLLVKEGNSISISRRSIEKIQIDAGNELVFMDGEVAKSKDDVSETHTVGCSQDEALNGNPDFLLHEDPFCKENSSVQDVGPEKVYAAAKAINSIDDEGATDLRPIKEKPIENAPVALLSSHTEVTDGPQSTPCAPLHGKDGSYAILVTDSVLPLAENHRHSKFDSIDVHAAAVEVQKSAVEDRTCTTSILEPLVGKNEVLVEGEVVLMNKEQDAERKDHISESDAMNEKHSFMDINHCLESKSLGATVESFPHEDPSFKEDIDAQEVKQEIAVQVDETAPHLFGREERLDSFPSKENPSRGTCVMVTSKSIPKITPLSETAGFCAAGSMDDPDSTLINQSTGTSKNRNADSDSQVSEFEQMKNGTDVLNVRSPTVVTELVAEQIQVVEGKEVSQMQFEVLASDALEGNFSIERNHVLGAEVVSGSEALPNMDLTDVVFTSVDDEKHVLARQVAEAVFSQVDGDERTDSHTITENLTETIVDSSSVGASVDGSPATCLYATLGGDTKLWPFADGNVHSEVQVTKGYTSLSDQDQTLGTPMSDVSTTDADMSRTGEISQTDPAGGSSQLAENQAVGSYGSAIQFSQINSSDHIMRGLDASCPWIDANCNIGFEVLMQDTSQPIDSCGKVAKTEETKNEVQSSGSDHSDENAAEQECEFSDYALVWGKVRSHPWWPGQIFQSSDASDRAMKHQKRRSHLVAYFGDQTFAWNYASSLKPFRAHFSQMEKQSSSESFRTAVDFALDEVSRRVELGLFCSCMPKEAYAKVKSQTIKNAGIREEASTRDGLDKSLAVYSFEPDKVVKNIKALALSPYDRGDRLELTITKAQLLAFYRFKGYPRLPGFHVGGGLVEHDVVNPPSDFRHPHEMVENETPVFEDGNLLSSGKEKPKGRYSSRKCKYNSDEGMRKERSISELMSEKKAASQLVNGSGKSALSSGKKRKALNSFSVDTDVKSRKHLSPSRDADNLSPGPQSFKVGDCFRRIASQLTGAPPILKCSGERFQKTAIKADQSSDHTPVESSKGRIALLNEYSYAAEDLSQLRLAAQDPMKRYNFLTKIIGFFTGFRNSISIDNSRRKKKQGSEKMSDGTIVSGIREPSNIQTKSNKPFDFEDLSDTYWTDRVIQSSPEDQASGRNRNSIGESQFETPLQIDGFSVEAEYSLPLDYTLDSEKQNLDDDLDLVKQKPTRKYQRRKKRKSDTVMDEGDNSSSKRQTVGGGDHAEQPEQNFNENNYVDEFCPTALLMTFTEADAVPSAIKLNRIFSRFGPLKESETEVLTNTARVVFKKRTDAEVALSSARKFSIFGQTPVNYELSYLSSVTCKAYSDPLAQVRKDAPYVEDNTIGWELSLLTSEEGPTSEIGMLNASWRAE